MKTAVNLFLILLVFWLLWSGIYTTTLLVLAGVSCSFSVWITVRMRFHDNEEVLPLRVLAYWPWLAWEVVKANVDVAWRIVHPRLPIAPRVVKVRASQRRDLGRAIYANSITLTPGTVSIDMEGDVITVHALTAQAAEAVEEGSMDRRVTRLEGKS